MPKATEQDQEAENTVCRRTKKNQIAPPECPRTKNRVKYCAFCMFADNFMNCSKAAGAPRLGFRPTEISSHPCELGPPGAMDSQAKLILHWAPRASPGHYSLHLGALLCHKLIGQRPQTTTYTSGRYIKHFFFFTFLNGRKR